MEILLRVAPILAVVMTTILWTLQTALITRLRAGKAPEAEVDQWRRKRLRGLVVCILVLLITLMAKNILS